MRELNLLQHIYAHNDQLPGLVQIPPGDDMGAIQLGDQTLLLAVDQVIDGIHVDLKTTSLQRIGRKAVTRNLSDVAAMAAVPLATLATATLPRTFGQDRAEALFDAMRQTAQQYQCPLVGGDMAIGDGPLHLTVTILAKPDGIEPVLRSGSNIGDVICVTGQLGRSLPTGHHLDFLPRLQAARTLASDPRTRPHAMIDLSDGLGCDLKHLCDASNLSAILFENQLPYRDHANWTEAVGNGEDYELCFTMDPQSVPKEAAGVRISVIGQMIEVKQTPTVSLQRLDGSRVCLDNRGWEHQDQNHV